MSNYETDNIVSFEQYRSFIVKQKKVPFLPTEEQLAPIKQADKTAAAAAPELHLYELELRSGDRESFLPLAEMYMGTLTEGIPEHERKLRKHETIKQMKGDGEKAHE
jgi:hypothetical protein